MKKRILSAGLALCLILGLSLPAGAVSASGQPTFTDVPANHWAYTYVEKAAEEGWVAGIGDGLFGVDNQVTYAEFSTMLVRAYYEDELNAYSGPTDYWYTSFSNVANNAGLYDGTPMEGNMQNHSSVTGFNAPVNRYAMAQMLSNVLEDYDAVPEYDAAAVQASISDWYRLISDYRDAVEKVVAAGLISGTDESGRFDGVGYMTRGQAAVVMCRLDEVINGGGVTQPEDPEPTPDPEPVSGTLKNGKEATPENVIEMLKEIEQEYPTGMLWCDPYTEDPNTNYNPNPVSTTVTNVMYGNYLVNTKYGCGGFAAMVSDLIFPEDMPLREVTDFSKVRPGDIVFNVGRSGAVSHVWVALSESYLNQSGYWKVSGRADGNYPDEIRWDWTMGSTMWTKDEVPGLGYNVVYTRYPD